MKRFVLAVTAFFALVLAAVSSAFTASGSTVYNSGGAAFSGARVTIYSYQNGSGSTTSDGSGNYSFGGLVAGQIYYFSATGCKSHSAYAAPQYQYGGSGGLPTLRMIATGSC